MNFDYSEEQQLLADSVRRILEKEYDFEKRRKIVAGEGWSRDIWAKFAEMGLTGIRLADPQDSRLHTHHLRCRIGTPLDRAAAVERDPWAHEVIAVVATEQSSR